MSAVQGALAIGRPVASNQRKPPGHGPLRGSDLKWAIAFVVPYLAVFFAFVVYPYGYALWMASKPSLYADLIADRSYLPTVVNTLVFVGLGVNLKMFLALLLSGFFMRRRRWIRALLAVYVLPWAIATAQACVSFHWMLQGDCGLVDRLISEFLGVDGPNLV
jgi:multiple sugar transport system permease protein